MEYSVLRQVMLESNVRLHILINDDFVFEKQRLAKIFYGMDSTHAFTKKDFRELKGDRDLRRQAKLPKSMIAYCAPLALETNGIIIFSFLGSSFTSQLLGPWEHSVAQLKSPFPVVNSA